MLTFEQLYENIIKETYERIPASERRDLYGTFSRSIRNFRKGLTIRIRTKDIKNFIKYVKEKRFTHTDPAFSKFLKNSNYTFYYFLDPEDRAFTLVTTNRAAVKSFSNVKQVNVTNYP